MCSIERLDENKGYIKGNVALICKEFNTGFYQWSSDKFKKYCLNRKLYL